jgi:hypothetical protein
MKLLLLQIAAEENKPYFVFKINVNSNLYRIETRSGGEKTSRSRAPKNHGGEETPREAQSPGK